MVIHMRRVLKWKSKVLGEPVSTVMEEAPGACGDQRRPLSKPMVGVEVVGEGSSVIE